MNKSLSLQRLKKAFLITALSVALLAGCAAEEPEVALPPSTPVALPMETAATEEILPRAGGRLTVSMRAPKTLNPLLNEDVTVDKALRFLFEPLAVLDSELKPMPNPAFVESFDFASDGMSVLVTLKSDKYWSDGSAIRAADLIFSLDVLRGAKDTVIYKENISNVLNYNIISERAVNINLVEPYSGTAYALCFPIIPSRYYKNEAKPDLGSVVNMEPVGNGLYKFVSYTLASKMELTMSEYSTRGLPYIDDITVLVTKDAESDMYAFDRKIIDVTSAQLTDWGKYRSSSDSRLTEYITGYFDFVGFNCRKPVFADKSMRQAVAHCVPVTDIISSVFLSHAEPSVTPVNPESWLHEADTEKYDYDLEKASALLAEAGWKDIDGDGRLEKSVADGTEVLQLTPLAFTILVNEENNERVMIASKLQESLKKAGMNAEVVSLPFEEYKAKLESGDYDIFVGGYNLGMNPDLRFAFYSSNGGTTNYSGFSTEEMDMLLLNAKNAATELHYQMAMSDLQKYIAKELPMYGLLFRKAAVITNKVIYGEIEPQMNNIYANVDEWFIYGR